MRVVTSPLLAVAGLVMLGAVAVALLSGSITLVAAGERVAVGAAALFVVDRFVLPLAKALLGGVPGDDDPAG